MMTRQLNYGLDFPGGAGSASSLYCNVVLSSCGAGGGSVNPPQLSAAPLDQALWSSSSVTNSLNWANMERCIPRFSPGMH